MTAETNDREVTSGAPEEDQTKSGGRVLAYRQALPRIKAAFKRFLGPGVALLVFGAALWVLYRELQSFRYEDVAQYLATLSPGSLLLAFALTALSYGAFIGHDALALRYVGHPLPYRRVVLASLIGFGISNAAGQAWLTGGAVRYRLYPGSWTFGRRDRTRGCLQRVHILVGLHRVGGCVVPSWRALCL